MQATGSVIYFSKQSKPTDKKKKGGQKSTVLEHEEKRRHLITLIAILQRELAVVESQLGMRKQPQGGRP